MMVKMYPFVMVSELSVKLWQTIIVVVYSNIFDMCYDKVYAANRFVFHLVREPLPGYSSFSEANSIKVSLAFSLKRNTVISLQIAKSCYIARVWDVLWP